MKTNLPLSESVPLLTEAAIDQSERNTFIIVHVMGGTMEMDRVSALGSGNVIRLFDGVHLRLLRL